MPPKRPRMCKKKNLQYAFAIGSAIMKDIEKKSFEELACTFHLPFGDFACIIVRESNTKNPTKTEKE